MSVVANCANSQNLTANGRPRSVACRHLWKRHVKRLTSQHLLEIYGVGVLVGVSVNVGVAVAVLVNVGVGVNVNVDVNVDCGVKVKVGAIPCLTMCGLSQMARS